MAVCWYKHIEKRHNQRRQRLSVVNPGYASTESSSDDTSVNRLCVWATRVETSYADSSVAGDDSTSILSWVLAKPPPYSAVDDTPGKLPSYDDLRGEENNHGVTPPPVYSDDNRYSVSPGPFILYSTDSAITSSRWSLSSSSEASSSMLSLRTLPLTSPQLPSYELTIDDTVTNQDLHV